MTRAQRAPIEVLPAPPKAVRQPIGGIPVYVSVLAAIGVSLLLWAGIIGLALLLF